MTGTMGELFLIIIAIILAALGDYTFVWILGGLLVLVLISPLFGGNGGKSSVRHERPRTRIRIPGYYLPDDYRCSICGAGFSSNTMTCPHCGVRFNNTRTDARGFIEEMDEEEWWEEMEEDR